MAASRRNLYFEQEILTATPQKLRLLLIEGALRLLRETAELWRGEQYDQGAERLERARAIVVELLASIDRAQLPAVTQATSELYAFLYRQLLAAGWNHDLRQLDDCQRVFEVERDTWRQVCEQLSQQATPRPHWPLAGAEPGPFEESGSGGFSVEA